jgi:hypothetical protein
MLICGVDPGVNTGYCLVEFLQDIDKIVIISQGVIRDKPPTVARFIASLPADIWAVESFFLLHKYAQEVSHNDPYLLTTRVIGGIETLVPESQLVMQSPRTKRFTPDEKLKELGFWDKVLHTRDAMRHAIYYASGVKRSEHTKPKKITGLSSSYISEG